ncbi:MAG TPA: hypothetical protein VFA60_06470 [Terriglobales bacterium]|nr:hypothetical protein [Terriglobales bacterium]
MTKFRRIVLLAATLAFSPLAFAAGKVESIGALTEASVPETIRGALEPAGYRVTLADGSTVELWLRKQAPSAKGDGIYNLAESALVGVIHFSKAAQDYRGQALPAGYYNLRYELQPSDGDHLGTSPTRDFLLLVPPASDTDPEKAYKFEELVALSRRIPGGRHPAPLNMPAATGKTAPSVFDDEEGRTALVARMKTSSGEVTFALVVQGSAPQ